MLSKHLPLSWVFLPSQQMDMWLLHAQLIGQVQGHYIGSRGEGWSIRILKQRGRTRVGMLSREPPVSRYEEEFKWLKPAHQQSLHPIATTQRSEATQLQLFSFTPRHGTDGEAPQEPGSPVVMSHGEYWS